MWVRVRARAEGARVGRKRVGRKRARRERVRRGNLERHILRRAEFACQPVIGEPPVVVLGAAEACKAKVAELEVHRERIHI